jgi:replicative DNA helicase
MSDEFYSNDRNSASPGGQIIPLRRPPYSTEAEQAVLGGLLLDNSAWRTVAELLTAEDFYRPDHRLIFDAIAQLARKGFPFDIVTLAEELARKDTLEEVGGFARLGILARDTPSAANVNVYARIVLERSIDRQRQAAAKQHNWAAIERLTQRLTTLQAAPDHRYTPITDAELWAKTFPPVRWAVPGIIPEGVTILAGSPKIGKSWLALGIAAAVASGGIGVLVAAVRKMTPKRPVCWTTWQATR